MNKIYEPGEMFVKAYYRENSSFAHVWDDLSTASKSLWARREKYFFDLLSKQCKEDEQTDDTSGVPMNDYPQY